MEISVDLYDVDGLAERLQLIEDRQSWLVAVLTRGPDGFREALEEEMSSLAVLLRGGGTCVRVESNGSGPPAFSWVVRVGLSGNMLAALAKSKDPTDRDVEMKRLEDACEKMRKQIADGMPFTIGLLPMVGGGQVTVVVEPIA